MGYTYTNECDATCNCTAPLKYKARLVRATLTAHDCTAKECTRVSRSLTRLAYKASDITNNSSRSLKVLDQGYVYCYGKSEDIYSLFAESNGSYGYFKSLGVSSGSSRTMLLCLENKMQFYTIYPTYVYVYIEYGGELFKRSCSTDHSGLNKCHTITWMIQD